MRVALPIRAEMCVHQALAHHDLVPFGARFLVLLQPLLRQVHALLLLALGHIHPDDQVQCGHCKSSPVFEFREQLECFLGRVLRIYVLLPQVISIGDDEMLHRLLSSRAYLPEDLQGFLELLDGIREVQGCEVAHSVEVPCLGFSSSVAHLQEQQSRILRRLFCLRDLTPPPPENTQLAKAERFEFLAVEVVQNRQRLLCRLEGCLSCHHSCHVEAHLGEGQQHRPLAALVAGRLALGQLLLCILLRLVQYVVVLDHSSREACSLCLGPENMNFQSRRVRHGNHVSQLAEARKCLVRVLHRFVEVLGVREVVLGHRDEHGGLSLLGGLAGVVGHCRVLVRQVVISPTNVIVRVVGRGAAPRLHCSGPPDRYRR
mmetsp:Transcript_52293/g.147185  ORF Transcript_52293/g.147185 Transcript_52293/m.147185 type:complete len:373 (-) Transcript_52293:36-1154(-)